MISSFARMGVGIVVACIGVSPAVAQNFGSALKSAQAVGVAPADEPAPAQKPAAPGIPAAVKAANAASQPASMPASQPASAPVLVKGRALKGGWYVPVVLRSGEIAKSKVSMSNLDSISKAIALYRASNDDKYPASLDELVSQGLVPPQMLVSPVDRETKYVYVPGAKPNSPGDRIVVYDPVSYRGRVLTLKADNSVSAFGSEEDFDKAITSQNQ